MPGTPLLLAIDQGTTSSRAIVFDADGSAIIVHERPDPYGEGEPDTGDRVACGVIVPVDRSG